MNKAKSIIAVLLLVVITVAVVFGPHIVSGQSDKKLTEEKTTWNYKNQNSAKITDKQVAQLFYNGEIDVNLMYSFSTSDKNYYGTNNTEDISALLDVVFASDETIRSCFNQMISESKIISQKGILALVDSHPVVLDFLYVIAETNYGTFEFHFEKKTQTLINFSYYSVYPLDYTNSVKSENLKTAINDYYKNRLGLSDEQFFCQYETVEKDDFKDYCVYAGMINCSYEIDKEEQITDYTF